MSEDPTVEPVGEPVAATSGEQDHSDPNVFRGEDADAPEDTGRLADVDELSDHYDSHDTSPDMGRGQLVAADVGDVADPVPDTEDGE